MPACPSSQSAGKGRSRHASRQAFIDEGAYPPEDGEAAPEPVEEESKQVSIPAPDPALPPSFDSDSSAHHFRFLESANQARPFTRRGVLTAVRRSVHCD